MLKGLSKTISGLDYKIALLGAKNKQVDFHMYDTASSVFTEHYDTNAVVETRNLLCLDDLLTDSQFSKPDFIKVDTQGYELEILKGGEKTLSCAGAVLLEVSLINIYKEVTLVYDVLYFMKERGFVLFDICSLIYRPLDKSLYQSDFLFVKEDSFLRANKKWS